MSLPGCGGLIGVSWTSLCRPLLPSNLVTAPLSVQQLDSLGKVLSVLQALAAPSVRKGRLLTWAPESAPSPAAPLPASLCKACFRSPSSEGPSPLTAAGLTGQVSHGLVSLGNCLPVSLCIEPQMGTGLLLTAKPPPQCPLWPVLSPRVQT